MKQTTINDLCKVSEVELIYKSKVDIKDSPKIMSAEDMTRVFKQYYNDLTFDFFESTKMITLNRNNRVLGINHLADGETYASLMPTSRILAMAILQNACSVIICHNHPSGNKEPSNSDIETARKLQESLLAIEKKLLDFIIITRDEYYSLADNGHL